MPAGKRCRANSFPHTSVLNRDPPSQFVEFFCCAASFRVSPQGNVEPTLELEVRLQDTHLWQSARPTRTANIPHSNIILSECWSALTKILHFCTASFSSWIYLLKNEKRPAYPLEEVLHQGGLNPPKFGG